MNDSNFLRPRLLNRQNYADVPRRSRILSPELCRRSPTVPNSPEQLKLSKHVSALGYMRLIAIFPQLGHSRLSIVAVWSVLLPRDNSRLILGFEGKCRWDSDGHFLRPRQLNRQNYAEVPGWSRIVLERVSALGHRRLIAISPQLRLVGLGFVSTSGLGMFHCKVRSSLGQHKSQSMEYAQLAGCRCRQVR